MATKEEKQVKSTELTVDNIEECIRDGAVVNADIAKAAAEKIAKQRNEELTEKLIDTTIRIEYTRKRMLLTVKKSKKLTECKLNYLKKITDLHEKLKTGDKSISVDEFDKKIEEEIQTANKLIREIENWYDEQLTALNNQYPNCWSWNMKRAIL